MDVARIVEEKHWKMFKYKDSNQMLEEDKLGIGRYTIHYSDIQKYTAKYYDSLWSHRRERLSAISSSAPGLLNSRCLGRNVKAPGTVLHQFFLIRILMERLGYPSREHCMLAKGN